MYIVILCGFLFGYIIGVFLLSVLKNTNVNHMFCVFFFYSKLKIVVFIGKSFLLDLILRKMFGCIFVRDSLEEYIIDVYVNKY